MAYTLCNDGDLYEIKGCSLGLNSKFPRYERIWNDYVAHLTNRPTDSRLKQGVPRHLEYLIMAHYSTWYHLTVAYRGIDSLKNEEVNGDALPEIEPGEPIAHLSSAVDMAIRTIASGLRIQEFLPPGRKQAYGQLEKDFQAYKINDWKQIFVSYTKTMTDLATAWAKLEAVAARIGPYRNPMIHDAIGTRLITGNKRIAIPKEKAINQYWLWSDVISVQNAADFEEAHIVYARLADDLTDAINETWTILETTIANIKSDNRYTLLFTHTIASQPSFPRQRQPEQPSGLRVLSQKNNSLS